MLTDNTRQLSSLPLSEKSMPIERIPLGNDRAQWLRERLAFINASEIAIVCGEAAYGSAAELYAEKKGLRPPRVDAGVLKRGRWGEGAVFEALAEERPEWEIRRAKVHVRDTERRLACTPDGFAFAPGRDGIGIVQAKVIARSIFRQRWLDNPDEDIDSPATPPTAYRLQTLMEEMLNATSWGVLAVLINGEWDWKLRLFDIERDEVLEDSIHYSAAKFLHDYLDANIMPPFEPQRDEKLIKALYPKDDGTEIDLSQDNRAIALVEDLIETQAGLKRLKTQEKEIKTELTGKLGQHSYGRLADGRCLSWRHQHRKAHAVAASDFRVLRILNERKFDD
jgi:predicted phage-related endonuclease